MIVYHTSDREIKRPDVSYSRLYLDFGQGFYTTENKVQAQKYAKRFFKEQRPAYLNVYEVEDDAVSQYSRKTFEAYDGEWLDYVVACRRNEDHELYDIVEGGIADDDVFNTLDLYMADLIQKEEAIKRLKKKKPNWQICFCNQTFIDRFTHHIESTELTDNQEE